MLDWAGRTAVKASVLIAARSKGFHPLPPQLNFRVDVRIIGESPQTKLEDKRRTARDQLAAAESRLQIEGVHHARRKIDLARWNRHHIAGNLNLHARNGHHRARN